MKALPFVLWLAALFAPTLSHAAPEVELMVEGDALVPSTTLEVRFAREMVKAEQVGVQATPSPVVVTPKLAGTFTWLSKRSGVFTPAQEPAMGATYTVSLLPGLKDAAGKAVTAKLQTKLKTPPFGVVDGIASDTAEPAAPNPKVQLVFNREVNLEGAEKFFRFIDNKGKTVAAKVGYSDSYDSGSSEHVPWELRWQSSQLAPKVAPPSDDDGEPAAEPTRNRLSIEPVSPLTPGPVWRLEIKSGLRAATGGYALARTESSYVGRVAPFTLSSIITSSYLNSGRSAELKFSRELSMAIKDDTAPKFFKITPEVKNLRFEAGYEGVSIHGDFQRDTDYRLEVSAELCDDAGVPLSGERVRTLRFGPVKPRVYLPVLDGHQMAAGRRKFPVTTVNMKSLHIIALLVPPEKAAQALTAFQQYERHIDGQDDNERFHPVAAKTIPGAKIYDRVTVLPEPKADERQELMLDWTELMAGTKAGTIFLTVDGMPMDQKAPRAGAQALVQMTDLGVLWKKVGGDLQLSLFSMATGQPVPDAAVTLLTDKFAPAGSARTVAAGTATLPVAADLAWLTVRAGDDVYTMRMGSSAGELPMAAFRLPIDYDTWEAQPKNAALLRALLFTERPLYRPGETAHVKGVVRSLGQAGLQFFAKKKGTLEVSGPHDHKENIETETDEHGAFDAKIELAAALRGGYSVRLAMDDGAMDSGSGFASFLTADYQPNAFEVKLAVPERFALGAEVAAEASGRYFFGAPLGKAHARWTLQEYTTNFAPDGFGEFIFGPEIEERAKVLTLHGEGEVPIGGALAIRPRLPAAAGEPRKGVLTVEVTDENQQTVSAQKDFTRDASDFYLGMKVSEGYLIGQTESMGALAIALRPDGTPVPQPVTVKAELVRVFYETVRVQGAGPAMSYRTEKRQEVVETSEGKTLVPQRAGAEWALPPGETARFKPGHGGAYLIRLTTQDSAGRTVAAEHSFSVSGTEPVAWDYRNPAQVEMIADKADYHPGETARLLIKTPIAGEALVNVERDDKILRTLRLTLTGNAPTLEIPLVAGDGPNVFVSMVLIRGAAQSTRKVKVPEYRYSVCRLHISEPETGLAVKITARVPKVEPGQEIVTEIAVNEANGKPAAGAEVTFFAVDDGVLALTGYERPKPLELFEKPFPLKIRTGLSLFDLLPEPDLADPIAMGPELANKGYLIGGGGVGGPGPAIRTDFPGTAAWEPRLIADKDGKVLVKFKAPDALTSYRLVAIASAGTNRFGSAESNVQISKRLILLSALGQFAHAGDDLIARAVVRNESAVAGTAGVTLELDATAEKPAQPLQANVELQPGEAHSVDFPVKLRAPGAAKWKWTAQMKAGNDQLQDGLLASLQIVSPAPTLRETYLPDLSSAENDLLDGVNPQLLEGAGHVQVTLSNTRLASLRESSQALLEYPYGCAEQTTSAMIPWIVARDFGTIMPALADEKSARAALAFGIEKLRTMQTNFDGGLAYWPGGREPNLFATAYATLALALLAKQHDDLASDLDKLCGFLSRQLRLINDRSARLSLDDCALTVYALAVAGKPEPPYHEQLYSKRSQLTAEGRAFLACAMMEQEKYSADAVEKLLDLKAAVPECICWFGSATRERAIRLLAWSKFKPKDKEVARLTQELLAARVNGAWRTTQENAWALLALSRYFAAVEGEVKPVSGTLTRAAAPKPFALTAQELTSQSKFDFAPPAGLGALTIANPQRGALYGDVRFTVEPPVALQPRQDRGYGLSRAYYKIAADGSLQEANDLAVGDRVVVVLRLETPIPGHFVAIDDPLPAILEAVNPEFKSQAIGGAGSLERDWVADYREIRADRVLYFCDHLPAGTHTFRYLARVRSAGKVLAPSTKAEEMYRPERFGLAAGSTLESKAR